MIRQTVNARSEFASRAQHAFVDGEPLAVGEDQIEAVVISTHLSKIVETFLRGICRHQNRRDERAAAGCTLTALFGIAVVRERRKAAGARDAQPRPPGLEILARQYCGLRSPPLRRSGRARMHLVAVGRDYTRVLRISAPRDQYQAHRNSL